MMLQTDKELLTKDLCSRLRYGVIGMVFAECGEGKYDYNGDMIFTDEPFDVILDGINTGTQEIHVTAIGNEDTCEFIEMQQTDGAPYTIDEFKPYLRPMSSMTEDEQKEFDDFIGIDECAWRGEGIRGFINQARIMDEGIEWLNAHHFDYRGLIEKKLALIAPDDMYKKQLIIRV